MRRDRAVGLLSYRCKHIAVLAVISRMKGHEDGG